jgi:hypothetical protein
MATDVPAPFIANVEPVYYFAIGSMMNPTSLKLRGLEPITSCPAECLDFKLIFVSRMGPVAMAEAAPEAGASFHGVLHLMNANDMASLDALEMTYDRTPATCRRYDGTTVLASVYTKLIDAKGPVLGTKPQQRYIELMITGCKHFGVHDSHVALLEAIAYTPRKQPAEFAAYAIPEDTLTWTDAELVAGNGVDGAPIYMALNGKVLEWLGPPEHPFAKFQKQRAGTHIEVGFARQLYDVKYGAPERLEDFTREHAACLEDMSVGTFAAHYKVVALIPQAYRD